MMRTNAAASKPAAFPRPAVRLPGVMVMICPDMTSDPDTTLARRQTLPPCRVQGPGPSVDL